MNARVNTDCQAPLSRVFELQDKIASLHPCLAHPYPVAVANGNELDVYRPDSSGRRYDFIAHVRVPMTVPDKVRAAFPLEDLEGMMACVVAGDVFATIDGYVDIFHEFVHCYQFEQCESDLKQSLDVAVKAKVANDYMWEINYPFPYQDARVRDGYSALLESLRKPLKGTDTGAQGGADGGRRSSSGLVSPRSPDYGSVSRCRKSLRETLGNHSFEYMVWQEWKEGFARYIENRIRVCLGLPLNLGGDLSGGSSPLARVSFYAGGAALIGFLESLRPEAVRDLRLLFAELMAIGADN